jgi:hypothetical protein
MYGDARVAEFDREEADLARVLAKRKKPRR